MNKLKKRNVNSEESIVASPDPTWRGLYRAGGISAFLYVILGIIVPGLLLIGSSYSRDMNGVALLQFIASNRIWWFITQTLTLGASFLAIVVFVALYAVLKHINKSYAAIGTIIAIVCETLFIAFYPLTLGLLYMSDQYVLSNDTQRIALATASESLLAQNTVFNPFYDLVFVTSILIISLVMLKGVFHKSVAYLGIATTAAAIICVVLWPILEIAYFWWWLVFLIWFIAVGWKLYRLGKA